MAPPPAGWVHPLLDTQTETEIPIPIPIPVATFFGTQIRTKGKRREERVSCAVCDATQRKERNENPSRRRKNRIRGEREGGAVDNI